MLLNYTQLKNISKNKVCNKKSYIVKKYSRASLKVSLFQNVLLVSSFQPKYQQKNALPILGQNLSNFSDGILVETMKPKGPFEIN